LERKKGEGLSVERVSSELDVSTWSLLRWSRELESRGEIVPVELSTSAESEELSLVTPRGYRIEGLSEEGLLRLVERLG
jgi:transposase-like protein